MNGENIVNDITKNLKKIGSVYLSFRLGSTGILKDNYICRHYFALLFPKHNFGEHKKLRSEMNNKYLIKNTIRPRMDSEAIKEMTQIKWANLI